MAKIGSLLIDIRANVAQLSKDMQQARSTFGKAVDSMSRTARMFGSALAGFFAADAVIELGRRTIETAATIERAAQQIGIATSSLQELRYAASTVGVESEDLDQILRDLGDRMGDAASGSKSWQEAFAALGVEIRDAEGRMRSVEEVFLDVAEGMRNADSDATRLFRSMELFSDQGARLLPLLNQGADGIARLRQEARDLGIVMDDSTTAAADQLRANLDRLSLVGQNVSAGIMEELAPALLQISNQLLAGARSGGMFSKVVSTGFKLVASVVQIAIQIFNHFGKAIGGVAAALVELFQGNFRNAWQIATEARDDILSDWGDLGSNLAELWSGAEEGATAAGAAIERGLLAPLNRTASSARQAAESIEALAEQTRRELGMKPGEKFGEAITEEKLEDRRWREFVEGWSTRDRAQEEAAKAITENLRPTDQQKKEIESVGAMWADSFASGFGQALGRGDTKGIFGSLLDSMLSLLTGAAGGPIGGFLGGLGGGLLDLLGFAHGGPVVGPGGPTDDRIPALLSNGEYVINARSARRLGRGFLDAINALGAEPMHRFAAGGAVGSVAGGAAGTIVYNDNRQIAAFDPRSMYEAAGITLAPALYRRAANRSDPKLTSIQRRQLAAPRPGRIAR